jgi:hypothetical protein
MLEYFPTNYVWNLSTNIALLMGGNIGEADAICRKLADASKCGSRDGSDDYVSAGCGMGYEATMYLLERGVSKCQN